MTKRATADQDPYHKGASSGVIQRAMIACPVTLVKVPFLHFQYMKFADEGLSSRTGTLR